MQIPADEQFHHPSVMRALHRDGLTVELEANNQSPYFFAVVVSDQEVPGNPLR
jgi:hypothetical protein